MIPPDTQRVLDFLAAPGSYPHRPAAVRLMQTHASWVFIAPPLVYKVKKPVNFGFLDFSTLELRQGDCGRELLLNRRLAADVYLDVVPVVETAAGLQLGGEGRVLEWTVKMRELDAAGFLHQRLLQGEAGTAMMDRVVDLLHDFYRGQPPLPEAESDLACRRLDEALRGNFEAMRGAAGHAISAAALAAIEHYTRCFEQQHRALLAARSAQGWIRDCHGDLHSEHIHISADGVRIYDCIEFNEAFRHIDVACDIAFLTMDLDFNGRPDLARHVAARFATLLQDAALPRLLDFYQCYRACVRGKVEGLHSQGETVGAEERAASMDLARRYFRLALRHAIAGGAPCVFVVMGRVACGKSALAQALGHETGWRVISSDRVRKTLAGVELHQRGTAEERAALYSAEMTQRVYDTLFAEATHAAAEGCIILDATFSKRAHRDALRALLARQGLACVWVVAEADETTTLRRLQERGRCGGVVSDARAEDHARINNHYEPPEELPDSCGLRITTHDDVSTTLARLLLLLAERNAHEG
ncbi:AAA family ATPase [Prosthecobacter sp.]|uniref:bifunctional aminoglycoside phosphotransferase/ATP-binding protein n=1 Tax=Prosthecobacter sp. TaxID=1965333 RepID=UPI0037837C47